MALADFLELTILALYHVRHLQPASHDLVIRPLFNNVGPDARHDMKMVALLGVKANFHGVQRGQGLFHLADPNTPVFIIFTSHRVLAAKERPPHAAIPTVIDADFAEPDGM